MLKGSYSICLPQQHKLMENAPIWDDVHFGRGKTKWSYNDWYSTQILPLLLLFVIVGYCLCISWDYSLCTSAGWASVCVWLAVGMRLSQVLYPLHDGKLFVQLLSEVCRELLLLFDYDYLLNRSFDLLIIRSVVAKCNIPAQSNKRKQMSYSCCCRRHRNRQQLQDDNR